MPKRSELRIVLPLTVEEYQIAQLYSVAEASKDVTGGGDGVEVLKNELYTNTETGETGQYTYKIYHFKSKVPAFIRLLAPEGSLEAHEEAWNAYPYCKTVITNPGYMKKKFELRIETWHKPGKGELENVHNLTTKELETREVVKINIADPVSRGDYKEDEDPASFHSTKTGRGPLKENWMEKTDTPFMCCYKLITVEFKWLGLQTRMENFIIRQERRFFTLLHRQLFCWLDKYHGMTMDDIRAIEDKTKAELDAVRGKGQPRGFSAADDKKSDKNDNEEDDDEAGNKAISK